MLNLNQPQRYTRRPFRSAEILNNGLAIGLEWDGGCYSRFHSIWLRDNANIAALKIAEHHPSYATHNVPPHQQKLTTLGDLPIACAISKAALEPVDGFEPQTQQTGNLLVIRFEPEGIECRYDAQWLFEHIYDVDTPAESDICRQPGGTELWNAGLAIENVTASYQDLQDSEQALATWLNHVETHGFARLTNGPIEPGSLLKVVELFGYVRETNYGRLFEVRTEIQAANLAYTSLGLQAHTDNPYRNPVPTLQLLYCLENSAEGGESQVIDGFMAATRLANDNPDGFNCLRNYKASFKYVGNGEVNLSASRPMIETFADGTLSAVSFNNRSAAPLQDVPYDDMAAYYMGYRQLDAIISDPTMAVEFKLQPGDCFLVDNTRVLHGRSAYSSEQGKRWLQGCYADKDSLSSKRRVLQNK